MRNLRIERALRSGPPFRPVFPPPMPQISQARASGARLSPIALLALTLVSAVVLGAIGFALYETTRNIGSSAGRITVEGFPVAVSFIDPSGGSLQLVEDFPSKKAWTEAGGSGLAERGIVLGYTIQPEVHQCHGSVPRVVVRRDPVGLLHDLAVVADFDVRDVERTSVGGRPAASALVIGPATDCGRDIHLRPIGLSDPSLMLEIDGPSRLIAIDVDGQTVLLQLWAQTEGELARWADELGPMLDSMTIELQRPPR